MKRLGVLVVLARQAETAEIDAKDSSEFHSTRFPSSDPARVLQYSCHHRRLALMHHDLQIES